MPFPPPPLPDQPAGLRGGRPAAQLRRRGRRAAPHPVGDQPADQGPRRRARRDPVRPRHALGADLARRPDAAARGRALARQARRQRAADPPLAQPPAGERHHLRLVRLALAAAADRGVPARASRHRHPRLGPRRDRRPRRSRARPRPALPQPGAGAGGRRAHVRRDPDAGGQPRPLGADPARQGAAAGQAGRPGAAHPGRGRRRPAEHRVPELAPLARRRRASPTCSRGAGCTSTSPTSRCRRRWPATASRWRGCRWCSRRCSAASWSSRSAPPAGSAARSATGCWSSPASRARSEVMEFSAWVEAQAAATRAAVETGGRSPPRATATAPASARPVR